MCSDIKYTYKYDIDPLEDLSNGGSTVVQVGYTDQNSYLKFWGCVVGITNHSSTV